jgi:hypothetical protein
MIAFPDLTDYEPTKPPYQLPYAAKRRKMKKVKRRIVKESRNKNHKR